MQRYQAEHIAAALNLQETACNFSQADDAATKVYPSSCINLELKLGDFTAPVVGDANHLRPKGKRYLRRIASCRERNIGDPSLDRNASAATAPPF